MSRRGFRMDLSRWWGRGLREEVAVGVQRFVFGWIGGGRWVNLVIGYICLFIFGMGLLGAETGEKVVPADASQPAGEKKSPLPPPASAATPSGAALAGRLIDQEPYDRIFLDEANNHVVLEVFPLDLPGRQVPQKPTQPLVVRLLNRPETKYEVDWRAVVKIELFEQRVLQEAQQYVQQARFEEAYEYFQYLYEHYPKMAGLEAAYQEALWQEAAHWYRHREYDRALAVLRTLWEKNKDRPNLDRAMGMAVERLVEQYVSAEDYESARALLRQLAGWYPEQEVVSRWEGQFRSQAAALQQQAKAALEKNALREASEAARKMMQLWPTLPGAKQLWEEVRQKYPRVVVGVCLPFRRGPPTSATGTSSEQNAALPPSKLLGLQTRPLEGPRRPVQTAPTQTLQPSPSLPPTALGSTPNSLEAAQLEAGKGPREPIFSDLLWWADRADWSAWRTGRLLSRQWMELVAPGSEGGQYRSPITRFQIEELGRRLVFQLRPNLRDQHGQEWTGYRLAELLLKLADPNYAEYRPEWADRVESIRVKDIYTVEVSLRRAHVRPEALLSFPIGDLPGPYQLLAAQDRQTIFLLHPEYFASSASQPKEIVELTFSNPREALAALQAGTVDLVDRIPPTEVPKLRESKQIVVGQYALPLLHVLVLNPNRPLMKQGRFRRALEYGICREEILAQICGGLRLGQSPAVPASLKSSPKEQTQPETQPEKSPHHQPAPETKVAEQPSGQAHPETHSAEKSKEPLAQSVPPQIKREIRLLPGFQVLSAPIPVGVSYQDPVGYAYDRGQKPRTYNPRLALALARLSWAEVSGVGRTFLESAQATQAAGAGPAPGAAAPPEGPAAKPSVPSTQPADPKQSPSPKSPQPPIAPSPQPPKAEPPPEQPPKAEPSPPSKKPVADPFAEEAPPEPAKDKPSMPPSEKPAAEESPKPPAEPKPPAKTPADPFSEGTSEVRREGGTRQGGGGDGGCLAAGPEGTARLLGQMGGWGVLSTSAPANPFAEPSAGQQIGSSAQGPPVETSSLAQTLSWEPTGTTASPVEADPFAEEQAKPKPPEAVSEKPASISEKPVSEQPVAKPSETAPASKAPMPTAKMPGSSAAQGTALIEKPSLAPGAGLAEKPSEKGVPEEKPAGAGPARWERSTGEYLLDMPPLVLVHPPTEPARTACRQIRRMLRRVGIPIQLQEVHPAELFGPSPPEFDLAYVELVMPEPVADLPRLLADITPSGLEGSFLALALAELYQAPGWTEVRQALYRLHRITAQQVPIVPLWQTVEYFAYRRALEGIGPRPIRLYENVEQWRLVEQEPSAPSQAPKTPGIPP